MYICTCYLPMINMTSFIGKVLRLIKSLKASLFHATLLFDSSRFWFEQDLSTFLHRFFTHLMASSGLADSRIRLTFYITILLTFLITVPIFYIWYISILYM